MTQDTKLIAGVAAVVIIGAAGIAFLASKSVERDAMHNGGEVKPAAQVAEAVTPASYDRGRSSEVALGFDSGDAGEFAATPMEPKAGDKGKTFTVEAGVDYIARGLESWNARDHEKAAAYFDAAADEGPERAWTHYILALSRWKSGDADGAVVAMERSVAIDGTSVKTFVNLSRIQNDRGAYDAALEAARSALTIDSEDAGALFLEGRSLRNLDRRGEALVSLEGSVEIDPDNGYSRNLLGLTLLEMDRETEAVEHLEIATELAPGAPYIHNNLGMVYERCGDRFQAMHAYHAAAELEGEYGKGAANLARLDPRGNFEPSTFIALKDEVEPEAIVNVSIEEPEPADPSEVASTNIDTDIAVLDVEESGI